MSATATTVTETFTIANRLTSIERLSYDIEDFGREQGLSPRILFDANLALDEVLTNIISYAWEDDAEHEITIRVSVGDDVLSIETEDDGRPFDPLSAREPDLTLPVGERPVGGLGISLVRQLMTELHYERRGDRNVFRMARSLRPSVVEKPDAPVKLTGDRVDDCFVLFAEGRLDGEGASFFENELLAHVAGGERHVVVDCSRLDYINSAGLRVLLVAAKRLAAAKGGLALAAPGGQIRSVVEMVGFDSIFPVCDSVTEACAAVVSQSPPGAK